jgi:uncharacterized membrane protein YfcA
MTELLALPGDLTPAVAGVLVAASVLTSFLTASLGAGGGVMLLAIMAQLVPVAAIIPLHGVVQLGSNGGRAAMAWPHVDRRTLAAFLPGALVGALLGSLVLVRLPDRLLYLCIAAFILYLCWGPKLPRMVLGPVGLALAGAATTFLTLFAGATGPLVAAFVKQIHPDRLRTVATFAAVMAMQNVLKVSVFSHAGFELLPWLPLLLSMVASGALGTWLGLKVLKRMHDHQFGRLFNLVLSLLAARLVWQALAG